MLENGNAPLEGQSGEIHTCKALWQVILSIRWLFSVGDQWKRNLIETSDICSEQTSPALQGQPAHRPTTTAPRPPLAPGPCKTDCFCWAQNCWGCRSRHCQNQEGRRKCFSAMASCYSISSASFETSPLAWKNAIETPRGSSQAWLARRSEDGTAISAFQNSSNFRVITNRFCSFPEDGLSKIFKVICSNKMALKGKLTTHWTTWSSSSTHREQL